MNRCLVDVYKIRCGRLRKAWSHSRAAIGTCRRLATWLPETTVNEDQSGLIIRLPGYSYSDLDRYGNVSIHKVSSLVEAVRMSILGPAFSGLPTTVEPGYRDILGRIPRDRLIFAITAHYDIMPAFYDKEHLYNPLVCTDKIVNVGKTSAQQLNMMTSEKTGKLLHKSLVQIVVVDHVTRRPAPLPEYFADYFKSRNIKVPFERIAPMEKPRHTHIRQYTARWSDVDYYFHVNQAKYVRICLDALVEASRTGSFSALAGDLGLFWIKNYKCYYQGESTPGDVLDIHMWENPDNPMVLHVIAEKEGTSKLQCSFEFTNPTKKIDLFMNR